MSGRTAAVAKLALWVGASLLTVAAGTALLAAGLALVVFLRSGGLPGEVQLGAWRALGGGVLRQAVLPQLGLAFALWAVLLRRYEPRRMLAALLAAALLAFPPIGRFSFSMWRPGSAWDVAATWVLLGLAVALALALPRWLVPGLGAGAFIGPPDEASS